MSYALAATTWGAFPGHPITDIQSGSGAVGNAYLFARPQKSVVRGPFVAKPAPAWFATSRNAGVVMRKLLAFEGNPSWAKLPGLITASLKG
jgi:aldehyde dehydrogenase (NAD(P)+)